MQVYFFLKTLKLMQTPWAILEVLLTLLRLRRLEQNVVSFYLCHTWSPFSPWDRYTSPSRDHKSRHHYNDTAYCIRGQTYLRCILQKNEGKKKKKKIVFKAKAYTSKPLETVASAISNENRAKYHVTPTKSCCFKF